MTAYYPMPDADPRVGTPDCYCGHSTMRHHGSERPMAGISWGPGRDFTGCKDCTFCDYYKADYRPARVAK
jgi:hypothetical protein